MPPVTGTGDPRSEFLDTLKSLRVKAVCGREYVQVEKLRKWMQSGSPRNIDRLLGFCKRNHHRFSIDTKKLASGDKQCILVFSILIELDEGHLIEDLRDQEVWDYRLPVDLSKLHNVEKKLKNKKTVGGTFQ